MAGWALELRWRELPLLERFDDGIIDEGGDDMYEYYSKH